VVAKTTKGQSQKIQLYDYTAALIIGIDRYENLGASEQLTYAVKDAKGVEKVLRDSFQFDEIITLYNEQATRDKIMQALYGFRSLTPDGGVFVYFSGHGITISGAFGGKDLGYLLPYDGSLNSAEMYKNISMQQVKSDICVSITAKHVFFVFDACFAGLMLDTRATLIKPSRDFSYLKAITDERVRQVLTAGAKGEPVLDGGPGGHSVFTGRLIQALENAEDYVTARELGQYLKKRVYGDAAARGHTQRPVDGEIYGTGDFVFVPDLNKRSREISAEVDALEAEIARLTKLKEAASKARDQSMERQIERLQLIKEAELKQAQIHKRQKEEAVKRQSQSALEAESLEKDRMQREAEKEQRLAMLRTQAKKMLQDLSQNLIGGATIESTVSELKATKEQRNKIDRDFSTALRKQTQILAGFYDKKIARITDIPPWDKEFETKEDYQNRLTGAQVKAAPVRKTKEEKLGSLRHELETIRDIQLWPLDKQMKEMKEKRFTLPASKVSFKFGPYKLGCQIMLGDLTINGITINFYVPMPKAKARKYKYHSELLVPEVFFRAELDGKKFDKVIFHGPGENEIYRGLLGTDVSNDGRYIVYANGIVKDTNTGLEWKAGPDKDTNGNEARSWVQNLNLDGGGWRMPTLDELQDLYEKGAGNRNMTPLFKTTGWFVLSGETKSLSDVWYFSFGFGSRYWGNRADSSNSRAFAVRFQSDGLDNEKLGGKDKPKHTQSPSHISEIKRDGNYIGYANGIVKDTRTGLEWKVGPSLRTNWDRARSWVQNLNLDGGGWRMPTLDELQDLYEKGASSSNMTPLLKTWANYIWSGETKDSLWVGMFDFSRGYRTSAGRNCSAMYGALAVRSRNEKPADKGKLFVDTMPSNARVRILNIRPKFYQGMELRPGRYHVEASNRGYKTQKKWVNLEAGEDKRLEIRLE